MGSKKTALAVLAAAVVLATLFGSHRSLNAVRRQALTVFTQGEYGDGIGVSSDLKRRGEVCANLREVAHNNGLDNSKAYRRLDGLVTDYLAGEDVFDELDGAAQALMDEMAALSLSERDARHLSDFQAELGSIRDTIRRDTYTQMAEDFNTGTLGAFPANLLSRLTGIRPLPLYT